MVIPKPRDPLFTKAGIADELDEGLVELRAASSYVEAAKQQRFRKREALYSGARARMSIAGVVFAPGPFLSLQTAAEDVAEVAFARAADYDEDGAYPAADVGALHAAGLLEAPFPSDFGGAGLRGAALNKTLQALGSGSLPLGRLFEGHVNAIQLMLRYGQREQIATIASEAAEGRLFGVWNTDDSGDLRLVREGGALRLIGHKILASGAGHIERPIVTATDEAGRRLMVTPRLGRDQRADLSRWTAHGMRASATGTVDFSGIEVAPSEILGGDGDYERQPFFSAGAWRFVAVHAGGMARLFELLRAHLRCTGRGSDLHQAARLGQAAIAVETARLWVGRAAEIAESPDGGSSVAYVNLGRLAVERAGLDLMELVHRSVGLQSLMRPNPIERISRDLATYLRQPAPDRALTEAAAWILEQPDRVMGLRR